MKRAIPLAVVLALILNAHIASAQDMARYRAYALESSLASVVAASGARAADARVVHEQPARIVELQWRSPYVGYGEAQADPVRTIVFSFYDDALYQVIVNYDRGRTEGLTNDDIIESISAVYGVPVLPSAKTRMSPPPEAAPEGVVVARWEAAGSQLTLLRGSYSTDYQLILISNALMTRARTAIQDAMKQAALDAPRREEERRKKEAGEVSAGLDKARATNKAAFRP